MGLDVRTSSKAGTIRSLIIRAWRERWSGIQWGIHIKTVLPRYISGDIYHLSDCILQQALMGPLPNNLILSYLDHSLSSQIVSHGGVIESISKYDGFHKPHCIQALLNLLQNMMKSVSCKGKPEDCLMLAVALVGEVKWLVQVMIWSTQQLIDLRTAPEHSVNLNLAGSVLLEILDSPFLLCMLETGRREEPGIWAECVRQRSELEMLFSGADSVVVNKEILLNTICHLHEHTPILNLPSCNTYDSMQVPMSYSIHGLVTLDVATYFTKDASNLARHLLLIKKLKGMSVTELYLELLRSSFLGLSTAQSQSNNSMNWAAFTFIKVPAVIYTIHTCVSGEHNPSRSDSLLQAVRHLVYMTSLLDSADVCAKCNCLEYLLCELWNTFNLLNESDAKGVLATRLQESNVLDRILSGDSQSTHISSNPSLILKAQSTAKTIFKTLANKNLDSILQIVHSLSTKSRDLLLSAANASGTLHEFAKCLVKFNEMSVEPQPGESDKTAMNRAEMFNISFLLLCHIVNVYGIDSVVSDSCSCFIEKWLKANYPEIGKIKVPEVHMDMVAIEEFILQIRSVNTDSTYLNTSWSEVCNLSVAAMQQLVFAADHGEMPIQVITDFLDKLCRKLYALLVCCATYLTSQIRQAEGTRASRLLPIVHHLNSGLGTQMQKDGDSERHHQMVGIVKHMMQTVKGGPYLSTLENKKHSDAESGSYMDMNASSDFPLKQPLSDLLEGAWRQMFNTASVVTQSGLEACQDLLGLGGLRWFVSIFVKLAMENVFSNDLSQAFDLIFGIFHLDIVGCTITHLVYVLPLYLSGPYAGELLKITRATALAHFTVMIITSAWLTLMPPNYLRTEAGMAHLSPSCLSKKRKYHCVELEDMEESLLEQSSDLPFDPLAFGMKTEAVTLMVAVQSLFKLMNQICLTGVVSPVTHMIVSFLHECVASPEMYALLSLVPSSMIANLLPLLSDFQAFTYPEILALMAPQLHHSDTNINFLANQTISKTISGRSAAKLLCLQRNLHLMSASV